MTANTIAIETMGEGRQRNEIIDLVLILSIILLQSQFQVLESPVFFFLGKDLESLLIVGI